MSPMAIHDIAEAIGRSAVATRDLGIARNLLPRRHVWNAMGDATMTVQDSLRPFAGRPGCHQ